MVIDFAQLGLPNYLKLNQKYKSNANNEFIILTNTLLTFILSLSIPLLTPHG